MGGGCQGKQGLSGSRPSLLPAEVQVANTSTHHDAGGRARHTGVSGGADAPRGGKRLLERARRWRSGHVRGCEGVGVGLALDLRMLGGGGVRGTRHAVRRWPPGGAGDSRAGPGGPAVPTRVRGAARSPSAGVPCGSHWPATPSEAGAHAERTDVRLGLAPAVRASQRTVVYSSLGLLQAADRGWLEGQGGAGR